MDGCLRIDALHVSACRVFRNVQDGSRMHEVVTFQDKRCKFALRWCEAEKAAKLTSTQMLASCRTSGRNSCKGDLVASTHSEFRRHRRDRQKQLLIVGQWAGYQHSLTRSAGASLGRRELTKTAIFLGAHQAKARTCAMQAMVMG